MEHIKRRLIFYFYTFNNFIDNRAIKIHLKCLKHYSNVFDEALFVVSLDDVNNTELIFNTEAELLKLGFKDIHFKVHKNNGYCEAQPFYEEIVRNLKVLDGLTFFGHTKGVTNYSKEDINIESIDAWLTGMYYLNLEFVPEVEYKMIKDISRFYGAFLTDNRDGDGVNWFYSGTFFWLNCQMLYIDEITNEIEIPTYCHQRGFAESFPGLLYGGEINERKLDSHESRLLYPHDAYFDAVQTTEFLAGEGVEEYKAFKKTILDEI